jgi:hypothetical protein
MNAVCGGDSPGFVADRGEFWHNCGDMQPSPEKNSSTPASVPSDPFPSSPSSPDAGLGADPGTPNAQRQREIGGPAGPEPTRFGDWERKGRCIDF